MKYLIKSMDNYSQKSIGENAHIQNDWSNDTKKKITELYFQLVRNNDHTDLKNQWIQIVTSFIGNERDADFCYIVKMIANTRDITDGKGEQQLSFMLLYNMWYFYPKISQFVFMQFLNLGSFKDIKYFCNYIKEKATQITP
jgi:hypothetical protein